MSTKITTAKRNHSSDIKQPKFYEIKEGIEYFGSSKTNGKLDQEIVKREQMKKLPLMNRLKFMPGLGGEGGEASSGNGNKDSVRVHHDSYGNKQMTFLSSKARREKETERRAVEHHNERKQLRRSAGKITKTLRKPSALMNNKSSNKFFKKSK